MLSIPEILGTLAPVLCSTNIGTLADICQSMLIQPYRITTTSLSRTTDRSLRTLERFYAQPGLNWLVLSILLFKTFLWIEERTYLLAFDETVEKKVGKATFGLERFYSSLFGRAIPSISMLGVSLIDPELGKSIPLHLRLLTKSQENSSSKKQKLGKGKGKRGRPKGSKNKPYQEPESYTFQSLKEVFYRVLEVLSTLCSNVKISHVVMDGYFGNQHYLKLVRAQKMHFICRFKKNTALFFPFIGIQKRLGRRRKYGTRIDIKKIPKKYKVQLPRDHRLNKKGGNVYQFQAYAKGISKSLMNVVVIVDKSSGEYTLFMSSDLDLDALKLLEYYGLRFQIEFSFREAKQYFGLSHFQNYRENQVKNATQLSFFMVLLSLILCESYRKTYAVENFSIRDLKSCYRASYYSKLFLNIPQIEPEAIFNSPQMLEIVRKEAVNL